MIIIFKLSTVLIGTIFAISSAVLWNNPPKNNGKLQLVRKVFKVRFSEIKSIKFLPPSGLSLSGN
jgi:hypothetical protein